MGRLFLFITECCGESHAPRGAYSRDTPSVDRLYRKAQSSCVPGLILFLATHSTVPSFFAHFATTFACAAHPQFILCHAGRGEFAQFETTCAQTPPRTLDIQRNG